MACAGLRKNGSSMDMSDASMSEVEEGGPYDAVPPEQ